MSANNALNVTKLAIALTVAFVLWAAGASADLPTVTTTIKLGGTVPMLDSGQAVSYVGVPVSIRCPADTGPTQFNFSVTQSQSPDITVTGSGYIMAQCSGKVEKFVVAVQSSFGSLYQEGRAVASVNCFYPCVATANRKVTISRLVRYFLR